MKPVYPVPSGYESQVKPHEVVSVRSCPDCSDCLDVYPLNDGKNVLLVGSSGHLVITIDDLNGLKGIKL